MQVCITEKGLTIGDKSVPIYSAEFHYFRNKKIYWRQILQGIKDAGFTVVCSFIQPNWHEYEQGKFDFVGKTSDERDLPYLLTLAKEVGLYVHLRISPGCCEWRDSGKLRKGSSWFKMANAFIAAVKNFTVHKNGTLAMIQVHNEWFDLMGNYYMLKNEADAFDGFHEMPMWEEKELTVPFFHYRAAGEEFTVDYLTPHLQETYRNISTLNRTWGTKYRTFTEITDEIKSKYGNKLSGVMQFIEDKYKSTRNIPFVFTLSDWIKLYMAYALRKYSDYVKSKLHLPTTHNWPSLREDIFNRTAHLDLSGYDTYCWNWIDLWPWVYNTDDLQGNKYPYCGEFICGVLEPYLWGGLGNYSPEFVRLTLLSFFAVGLKGVNLYMFVERDNWTHSPIDERGQKRATYYLLSNIFQTLHKEDWISRKILRGACILKYLPYMHYTGEGRESFYDRGTSFQWIHTDIYHGSKPKTEYEKMFINLHEAGVGSCSYRRDDTDEFNPESNTVILYTMDFMNPAFVRKLLNFVHQGGNLILFPVVPVKDVTAKKMNMLVNLLGIREMKKVKTLTELDKGTKKEPYEVTTFRIKGTPTFKLKTVTGKLCGFGKKYGTGEMVVLGFSAGEKTVIEQVLLARNLVEQYTDTGGVPVTYATIAAHPDKLPVLSIVNGNFKKPVRQVKFKSSGLQEDKKYVGYNLLTGESIGKVKKINKEWCNLKVHVPLRDVMLIGFKTSSDETAGDGACLLIEPEKLKKPVINLPVNIIGTKKIQIETEYPDYFTGTIDKNWTTELGISDWTYPALGSGKVMGIQGWYWLKQVVEIPNFNSASSENKVYLKTRPYGWHNVNVYYINGVEVGQNMVKRTGVTSIFDVTHAVKFGQKNVITIRTYRQTLDCNDTGGAGFEELAFSSDEWKQEIKKMYLIQEKKYAGEETGLPQLTNLDLWENTDKPLAVSLVQNREKMWFSGTFTVENIPTQTKLKINGSQFYAYVYVNGQYVGKTPYLPATIDITSAVKQSKNTIVLCLIPQPDKIYFLKKDQRYRVYIDETFTRLNVNLTELNLELSV